MEISIGSYKFRLEILIIIVVVFWVMWGHMLCSCSKVGLMEGFEVAKNIGEEIGKMEWEIAIGNWQLAINNEKFSIFNSQFWRLATNKTYFNFQFSI